MDEQRLTRGEMLAGIAGIALIVISVIPQWGSVSLADGERVISVNGSESVTKDSFGLWEEGNFSVLPKLAAILGLVAVILVLVRALGAVRSIPSITYLVLGVTVTLLMLMGLAVGPSVVGIYLVPFGVEVTRGPLLYAGAVLSAVITLGGWLHLRSEDTDDFGNRSAAPPPM